MPNPHQDRKDLAGKYQIDESDGGSLLGLPCMLAQELQHIEDCKNATRGDSNVPQGFTGASK